MKNPVDALLPSRIRFLAAATGLASVVLLPRFAPGQGYPLWEFVGAAPDPVGGSSVASPGDLDGDGVSDLLVGAPRADPGGLADAGQVKVFSGATGALLATLAGQAENDAFGVSLAGLGDVDGDGIPDFVAGASRYPYPLGIPGYARVFSGSTGTALLTLTGSTADEFFGAAVAGLGDLDADGVPDFAVGSPYATLPGLTRAGRAVAVSGGDGAVIHQWYGSAPFEFSGTSIASGGDLDGDGVPEVLVGAPVYPPAPPTTGSVRVFSGATGVLLFTVTGSTPGDHLGAAAAGVGDVTGDGVPELFLGAPGGTDPWLAGYARLASGSSGATLLTLGTGIFDAFGTAVGTPGDLTGDGIPDLMVGAPRTGAGPGLQDAGRVTAYSAPDGSLLFGVTGVEQLEFLGYSLCAPGDIDGDGIPDLFAGGPNANSLFGEWAGEALVLSGADGSSLLAFEGDPGHTYFGLAVAGGADLDGDGHPEILVGAPNATAPGIIQTGRLYTLSGAWGYPLWAVEGSIAHEGLARSLAIVGDLDGDGIPDIAAGGLGSTFVTPPVPGRLIVLSGASGAVLQSVVAASPYGSLGWAVSAAGDVDGDGTPDILAGLPGETGGGQARVYSGATAGLVLTLGGNAPTDLFGTSIAGLPDLNGDGVPELAVGAPQQTVGYAKVLSGADGSLLFLFNAPWYGDRLGYAVASVGDVNGDGTPDVAVGAPQAYSTGSFYYQSTGPGYVRVYSGETGGLLLVASGVVLGDSFGRAVAGMGDVNGDGLDDFLAAGLQGGRYVRLVSGQDGLTLLTTHAPPGADSFAESIHGAGDVDQDGSLDFLVGAPLADVGNESNRGKAYVFSAVGLPPGTSDFGSGCPGTGGFVPRISTFGGTPLAADGNDGFGIAVLRGLGGSTGTLLASDTAIPYGIPLGGCALHLAPPLMAVFVGATLGGTSGVGGEGHRLLPLPVPSDPALAGAALHLQWAILDPGGPGGVFTTSEGLTVTVQ